jgi:ATP-dependent Clp protease ATP-binding subunit ClpC
MTPKLKAVIEASHIESKVLGHEHAGTGHMLLGLALVEFTVPFEILRQLNVSADLVRSALVKLYEDATQPVTLDD